jgi:NADPH:quinone reductase-like Zn-dependent oxidoreductase
MGRLAYGLALSWLVRQRLCTFVTKPSREDLELLRELIDSGKLRPEIDRVFGLDEVPEAIRALEAERVQGKIVVSV